MCIWCIYIYIYTYMYIYTYLHIHVTHGYKSTSASHAHLYSVQPYICVTRLCGETTWIDMILVTGRITSPTPMDPHRMGGFQGTHYHVQCPTRVPEKWLATLWKLKTSQRKHRNWMVKRNNVDYLSICMSYVSMTMIIPSDNYSLTWLSQPWLSQVTWLWLLSHYDYPNYGGWITMASLFSLTGIMVV